MRILVTGHTGYIGSVMVPLLRAAGHEVVGFDSDWFEPCLLEGQPVDRAVPTVRKDLRDVERRDLEGFAAVIHLAGLSNDPLGNLNPVATYEINDAASIRFARLAKQAGVTASSSRRRAAPTARPGTTSWTRGRSSIR